MCKRPVIGAVVLGVCFLVACTGQVRQTSTSQLLGDEPAKGYQENGVLASIIDSDREKEGNRVAP